MQVYIALFEYVNGKNGKDGYGVVFPDFPGLVTAGDTYEEAYRMAHEGLAAHVTFLERKNCAVPEPRTMDQIENTWEDWDEWKEANDFITVPINKLPVSTRAKRINIFIKEGLLAKLDMVAKNRSEYISQVLEQALM